MSREAHVRICGGRRVDSRRLPGGMEESYVEDLANRDETTSAAQPIGGFRLSRDRK